MADTAAGPAPVRRLAVLMVPPCEFERSRNNAPIQAEDTLYFDVRFRAPCSDVRLASPVSDWLFNEGEYAA